MNFIFIFFNHVEQKFLFTTNYVVHVLGKYSVAGEKIKKNIRANVEKSISSISDNFSLSIAFQYTGKCLLSNCVD